MALPPAAPRARPRRAAGTLAPPPRGARASLPPPPLSQVVYAVLGTYGTICLYFGLKSSSASTAAVANAPAPTRPDYHTPLPAAGTPDFGTPAWEKWVETPAAAAALK